MGMKPIPVNQTETHSRKPNTHYYFLTNSFAAAGITLIIQNYLFDH